MQKKKYSDDARCWKMSWCSMTLASCACTTEKSILEPWVMSKKTPHALPEDVMQCVSMDAWKNNNFIGNHFWFLFIIIIIIMVAMQLHANIDNLNYSANRSTHSSIERINWRICDVVYFSIGHANHEIKSFVRYMRRRLWYENSQAASSRQHKEILHFINKDSIESKNVSIIGWEQELCIRARNVMACRNAMDGAANT